MEYKKIYDPNKGFICDYAEKKVNEIRFILYKIDRNKRHVTPVIDHFKENIYKLVDPREHQNLDLIIKELFEDYNQIKSYLIKEDVETIENIIKELIAIFSEPVDPLKARRLGRNIDELLIENKYYIKKYKKFARNLYKYKEKTKLLEDEIHRLKEENITLKKEVKKVKDTNMAHNNNAINDVINKIENKNKKLRYILKNNFKKELLVRFANEIDQLLETLKQK